MGGAHYRRNASQCTFSLHPRKRLYGFKAGRAAFVEAENESIALAGGDICLVVRVTSKTKGN